MSDNKPTPPAPHFTLKVDNEDFEVFMSFGLLNELTALIGDPARCASIFFEAELRETVLRVALAERSKTGKIVKQVDDITDIEIDLAEVQLFLSWIASHVLSFFTQSLKSLAGLQGDFKAMADLESSLVGSKDSPSKKAPAGPSASRRASSAKSTGDTASPT